jgi:prepilin-type processing-associated H-X9-DG protein
MANLTDGSSNTIAFGEALVGGTYFSNHMYRNLIDQVSIPSSALVQDAWMNYTGVLQALQLCTSQAMPYVRANQSVKGNYADKNNSWVKGNDGVTMFNTIVPPNAPQYSWGACAANTGAAVGNSDFANASSNHPGGANFLFTDGSVHFLKSSISMRTYWSLGTKSDGEVIDANSY